MSRRAASESVIVMGGPKAEYQHPANPRNRAAPAPPVSLDFLDPERREGLCWASTFTQGASACLRAIPITRLGRRPRLR